MSLLDKVVSGVEEFPPRILLYGCQGIGKTTAASKFPSPLILATEDGIGNLAVPRLRITSYKQLLDTLRELAAEEHDYKTVAIDTIDALEPMIWKQVCEDYGETTIERVDGGYHKGYVIANELYWSVIRRALDYLRVNKNMIIVLLGHSDIKRYDSPESDPYDRFQPKLHKYACASVCDWCDVIGYAAYKVFVKTTDTGFGKVKGKGIGSGARVLYLEERPAFIAKNRYQLPEKMDFDVSKFLSLIKQSEGQQDGQPAQSEEKKDG